MVIEVMGASLSLHLSHPSHPVFLSFLSFSKSFITPCFCFPDLSLSLSLSRALSHYIRGMRREKLWSTVHAAWGLAGGERIGGKVVGGGNGKR